MRIEFGQILLAMNGKPLQTEDPNKPGKARDLTLGRTAINALLSDLENERQTGAQKFDRFKLAMRIGNEEDPIEVTAEDIALIKGRIGRVYPTYVTGLAWSILEGIND